MDQLTIRQYAIKVNDVRQLQLDYLKAINERKPLTAFEIQKKLRKDEAELDKHTKEIITGESQATIF